MCKPTCQHNGGHCSWAGGTSHVVGAVSPPSGVHQRSESRMHRKTRIIAQSSFALLFAALFILSGCGSSSSGGSADKKFVPSNQLPRPGAPPLVGPPPHNPVEPAPHPANLAHCHSLAPTDHNHAHAH